MTTSPHSSHPRHFDFAFAPAYRLAALPLGITPRTASVRLHDPGVTLTVREPAALAEALAEARR